MKKIFLLLAIVVLSSCATNTSFNTFYQDNQKDSDFSLGLNSSLLSAFLSDEDFEDVKPLLKKAKNVKVLVFSNNAYEMNAKFDKFIKRSNFESLISLKDDGDKIKIFALENKDRIKEVVVDIKTDDDLILLGLKTNLTEEDLNKLIQDNDITIN